jgi:hypothetical protein
MRKDVVLHGRIMYSYRTPANLDSIEHKVIVLASNLTVNQGYNMYDTCLLPQKFAHPKTHSYLATWVQ